MSKALVDLRRPRKDADRILACDSTNADARKSKDPVGRFLCNKGLMSPQEFLKAWKEYAENDGPCPHIYQPILLEAAKLSKTSIAATGRGKSQPSEWDEKQLGKWNDGDVLLSPRLHHNRDLRKRCTDWIEGTLGTFVLGIDGINPQITGNYAAIVDALKTALFSGNAQLSNIVGRFNDEAFVDVTEDGGFIVWNPYQALTWGYLVQDGKRLSHAAIRKLEDADDVTFEELDAPVTARIPLTEVAEAVKSVMSDASTLDDNGHTAYDRFGYENDEDAFKAILVNVGTLCRFHPKVLNCFGLRNVQSGIPIFKAWDGTTVDDMSECVCMSVGARLPVAASENKWAAKARLTPDEAPVEPKKRGRKAKVKVDSVDGTEAPPVADTSETVADTSETVVDTSETAMTAADLEE